MFVTALDKCGRRQSRARSTKFTKRGACQRFNKVTKNHIKETLDVISIQSNSEEHMIIKQEVSHHYLVCFGLDKETIISSLLYIMYKYLSLI